MEESRLPCNRRYNAVSGMWHSDEQARAEAGYGNRRSNHLSDSLLPEVWQSRMRRTRRNLDMARTLLDAQLRWQLLSHLRNARMLTDDLFRLVQPDALYDRPISERHRIVFYLGHLE